MDWTIPNLPTSFGPESLSTCIATLDRSQVKNHSPELGSTPDGDGHVAISNGLG